MNDTVIKVERVSKKYCRSLNQTMFYGMQDIARNAVGLNSNSNKLRNGEFWALDDVSFEIKKGETLGIIGANGSGKTTLLKLLNGIFMPDKGRIEISGKVGALIEVGAGFHPMLTGRENIYVNGAILGMSKKEIDRKFDEIVDFADIGDFIDSPVKHYSSGMYMRLGFAIAVHCEPDILIMDEILAVGDAAFQKKCFTTLRKYIKDGGTLLFVSHDLLTTVSLCNEALLLHEGAVKIKGQSNSVVNIYKGIISGDGKWSTTSPANISSGSRNYRFGVGGAEIQNLTILNKKGQETKTFFTGEKLKVKFQVLFKRNVDNPIYGLTIKDKHGLDIYVTDTVRLNKIFSGVKRGTRVLVEMDFISYLIASPYFLSISVSELRNEGIVCLAGIFDAIEFYIIQSDKSLGCANLNSQIYVSKMAETL